MENRFSVYETFVLSQKSHFHGVPIQADCVKTSPQTDGSVVILASAYQVPLFFAKVTAVVERYRTLRIEADCRVVILRLSDSICVVSLRFRRQPKARLTKMRVHFLLELPRNSSCSTLFSRRPRPSARRTLLPKESPITIKALKLAR